MQAGSDVAAAAAGLPLLSRPPPEREPWRRYPSAAGIHCTSYLFYVSVGGECTDTLCLLRRKRVEPAARRRLAVCSTAYSALLAPGRWIARHQHSFKPRRDES
ncbi:hypothetical protein LY76DRAFT_185174 [Colletotrichum caudatum]|nr:hypothetical protein LY76DRAFT_185174 [Colletotrichum caudatum]